MNTKTFKPSRLKLAQAVALGVLALAATQAQATDYSFSDLGTINGPYAGTGAVVSGINNSGQVVGSLNDNVSGLGLSIPYVWNGNTATQLDFVPGGDYGGAQAINDAGQIAGWTSVETELTVPVSWVGTAATQLDTLGGWYGDAWAINNHGQMAGLNWLSDGTSYHAVSYNGTAVTDLGTLGGSNSLASGINDAGQVVGASDTTDGDANHAALWNGTNITDLGTLGGTNSEALAINEAGQIIGDSFLLDDETTHAVLWNGTNITDLGTLGGINSYANDINNAGQIVGVSDIADGSQRATLWDGTSLIDLNSFLPADLAAAGWVLNGASGINDFGVIIGSASNSLDPNTPLYGVFKLTAVPVPGAIWLFGSALAGFVGWGRRKQA